MTADLHQRLLAATQPPAGTPLLDLDPNAWLAALRAVVELHAPRPCRGMPDLCAHLDPHDICACCISAAWSGAPGSDAHCLTIQAIAAQLGLTDQGDPRG